MTTKADKSGAAERVAIFGAGDRTVWIYHLPRHQHGTGQTVCGRWYDTTCKRRDATRGGVRLCKRCEAGNGE